MVKTAIKRKSTSTKRGQVSTFDILTLSLQIFFLLTLLSIGTSALADPTSYIDKHNRFILNGARFFPLGLYVVECTNGSYTAELDEIAASPFDTLMNYGVNQCGGDATDAQILGYLDQLAARNLKLIFSLSEYFDGGQADIDTITHKVNTFKGHPAIISWYLNDERDPATYLTQLEERYQKIRELDENHPVWSVHWWPDDMLAEAHTTDIVGIDSYPIAHRPITDVSSAVDATMQAGKPLWFVPQIFSWTDYPWDFRAATGRPPTREEMRAMSYLATNHGAKGLIYYSYFNIRDDSDFNERWPQIKEIAAEVDQLRPVFLSLYETGDNDVASDNPDIDVKLMREGDTYYLFAVNTKEQGISAVLFHINLPDKPALVQTLFEGGRQLAASDGEFTDDFGIYEVHVYQWAENGPIIDKLRPRSRERGEIIRLIGTGFGDEPGDGEVRIGRRKHYEAPALGRGKRVNKIRLWSPTKIKARLSKDVVPEAWEGTKKYVWIEQNGQKSNYKKVAILTPSP
jgi:hypothetical protein